MASNVVTTLGQLANLAAEKAAFGQPDWTLVHATTASANTAVVAGVADVQHYLDRITLGYSAAPAVGQLQVKDGSTVIWQVDISATGNFVYDFDFGRAPLRASVGAALTVTVGSAGGAIVQTLSCIGHSNRSLTAFT